MPERRSAAPRPARLSHPASLPGPGTGDDLPADNAVETRLVTLSTADGVALAAALFRPELPAPRGTGVLLVHGNPGNFHGAVPRFLVEGLARAGYLTLALNLRAHDHHYATSRFADTASDLCAGIDYLEGLDAARVFLAGHSLGTIVAVNYAGAGGDARVAGLGLYAPLDDLPASLATFSSVPRPTRR